MASHSGSATQVHSLRGLEMLLRFDVARSPYQNESRLIALPASRETFSEYASHLMLLCMFRIVDHPINSRVGHCLPRLKLGADCDHGSISPTRRMHSFYATGGPSVHVEPFLATMIAEKRGTLSNSGAGRHPQLTTARIGNEKRPLISSGPFIGRPDSANPYVRSALLSEVVSANVIENTSAGDSQL